MWKPTGFSCKFDENRDRAQLNPTAIQVPLLNESSTITRQHYKTLLMSWAGWVFDFVDPDRRRVTTSIGYLDYDTAERRDLFPDQDFTMGVKNNN